MKEQVLEVYHYRGLCVNDIKDYMQRGWRVVSMVSIPTDMTTHEIHCTIMVVYEKEVKE